MEMNSESDRTSGGGGGAEGGGEDECVAFGVSTRGSPPEDKFGMVGVPISLPAPAATAATAFPSASLGILLGETAAERKTEIAAVGAVSSAEVPADVGDGDVSKLF